MGCDLVIENVGERGREDGEEGDERSLFTLMDSILDLFGLID